MKTKFLVEVIDGSREGMLEFKVPPGDFNGQAMTMEEKKVIIEFMAKALNIVHQIREHKKHGRDKANTPERKRSEDSDDVSEISLPSSGGNKVGIC